MTPIEYIVACLRALNGDWVCEPYIPKFHDGGPWRLLTAWPENARTPNMQQPALWDRIVNDVGNILAQPWGPFAAAVTVGLFLFVVGLLLTRLISHRDQPEPTDVYQM